MSAEVVTTLPVKTKEDETVKIVSEQLPVSLTSAGNLKVAMLEGQLQLTPEDRILDAHQVSGTYSPTAAGSTTIISPVSEKVVRVYDISLWNSGSADVGVRLHFGTSGKNIFKGKLAPKTGVVKSFVRPWQSNAGDSLVLYLDAAGTVDYCIGAVQA
ncbi:MAG: hypothetical protein QXN95_00220 [Candidatus Bathyarchaeia archaeon]